MSRGTLTEAPVVLSVRSLSVSYHGSGGKLTKAVDDVSFDLKPGMICGLVGESGCGKSTVSLALMGLLQKHEALVEGDVLLDGGAKDLLKLSKKQLRDLQGKWISMIFQDPMSSLNPAFTVGEQIVEPMKLHLGLTTTESTERAWSLLKRIGIADPAGFMNRYPHELSGGMRQRAMIAMAMACKPKVLVADEPTTALDVTIQAEILRLIVDLCKEEGAAVLFITHDLGVVAESCDEILVMYAGQIVERSSHLREVIADPQHPYTEALLGCLPEMNIGAEELPVIPGTVPRPGTRFTGCRFADRCAFTIEECRMAPIDLIPTGGDHAARCIRVDRKLEVAV
ncbi:ABC transporter ATP-binding protein [Microbacterium paludicola]|uniref:ABC transporter ATP-binding protein n=2 Tax=Microbacterium paludicola TaxID=300019 RepID=A0A4Y9FX08_9MICO|nr:ABC transporter ATP-binding protein [Microbacterium paludicola]TFU32785.1 ABC transporter ATP-binding protein [Microbacterium paludicola]